MLQLGHVFFRRCFLRERPLQHELCLEHRAARLDAAVEGGAHPPNRRMAHLLLDIRDDIACVDLVPTSIELLSRQAELDDEVAGKVLRFAFAPLFTPQP